MWGKTTKQRKSTERRHARVRPLEARAKLVRVPYSRMEVVREAQQRAIMASRALLKKLATKKKLAGRAVKQKLLH